MLSMVATCRRAARRLGRKGGQAAPSALEFVDSGDKAQDLRGDLECVGS